MEDLRLVCPDVAARRWRLDVQLRQDPEPLVAVCKDLPVNDIMNDFMKQAETPELWLAGDQARAFNSKTKASCQ